MAHGEIIWEDAPNEPANVQVHSCGDHIHLTVRCPLTPEMGYHVVLSAGAAVTLASAIVNGLDVNRDADEYHTDQLYIA